MSAPLYLDTSALAKLYVPEPETSAVERWVRAQDQPIPFSSLHELELASLLERKRGAGDASAAAVKRVWAHVEHDLRSGVLRRPELDWPPVFAAAVRLVRRHGGRAGLRALDSLHLAAAAQLRPSAFATFDRRQSRAAAAEGLRILP
jgi:uncharacterized protein